MLSGFPDSHDWVEIAEFREEPEVVSGYFAFFASSSWRPLCEKNQRQGSWHTIQFCLNCDGYDWMNTMIWKKGLALSFRFEKSCRLCVKNLPPQSPNAEGLLLPSHVHCDKEKQRCGTGRETCAWLNSLATFACSPLRPLRKKIQRQGSWHTIQFCLNCDDYDWMNTMIWKKGLALSFRFEKSCRLCVKNLPTRSHKGEVCRAFFKVVVGEDTDPGYRQKKSCKSYNPENPDSDKKE
jgi:hypothetical protein